MSYKRQAKKLLKTFLRQCEARDVNASAQAVGAIEELLRDAAGGSPIVDFRARAHQLFDAYLRNPTRDAAPQLVDDICSTVEEIKQAVALRMRALSGRDASNLRKDEVARKVIAGEPLTETDENFVLFGDYTDDV